MKYMRVDKSNGSRESRTRHEAATALVEKGYCTLEYFEAAESKARNERIAATIPTDWALWILDGQDEVEKGSEKNRSAGKRTRGDWLVRETCTRSAFSQDWREIVSDTRQRVITPMAYDSTLDGTVCGVQIKETDAGFIALAGTIANRLDEAGYDGETAIKEISAMIDALRDSYTLLTELIGHYPGTTSIDGQRVRVKIEAIMQRLGAELHDTRSLTNDA